MKTVAVILLEQFADRESTLLTPVLQQFTGETVLQPRKIFNEEGVEAGTPTECRAAFEAV